MTANNIFEMAMILIDETPVNGVFDADRTSDYKEKTPFILNQLQAELHKEGSLLKVMDITASGTEGFVKLTLPTGFSSIQGFIDSDLQPYNEFKRVGNDVYVPFDFTGKMVYRYIPTMLTDLDDALEVDDIIARTALANGLASQLILTENPDLSDYLNQRFQELKQKRQEPSGTTPIIDVYDSKLSY